MQALGSSLPVSWVMCTRLSQLRRVGRTTHGTAGHQEVSDGRERARARAGKQYEGVFYLTPELGRAKL